VRGTEISRHAWTSPLSKAFDLQRSMFNGKPCTAGDPARMFRGVRAGDGVTRLGTHPKTPFAIKRPSIVEASAARFAPDIRRRKVTYPSIGSSQCFQATVIILAGVAGARWLPRSSKSMRGGPNRRLGWVRLPCTPAIFVNDSVANRRLGNSHNSLHLRSDCGRVRWFDDNVDDNQTHDACFLGSPNRRSMVSATGWRSDGSIWVYAFIVNATVLCPSRLCTQRGWAPPSLNRAVGLGTKIQRETVL
jgi:hypothetical protein